MPSPAGGSRRLRRTVRLSTPEAAAGSAALAARPWASRRCARRVTGSAASSSTCPTTASPLESQPLRLSSNSGPRSPPPPRTPPRRPSYRATLPRQGGRHRRGAGVASRAAPLSQAPPARRGPPRPLCGARWRPHKLFFYPLINYFMLKLFELFHFCS